MERDKPMERDKRWRGTSDGIAWNGGERGEIGGEGKSGK